MIAVSSSMMCVGRSMIAVSSSMMCVGHSMIAVSSSMIAVSSSMMCGSFAMMFDCFWEVFFSMSKNICFTKEQLGIVAVYSFFLVKCKCSIDRYGFVDEFVFELIARVIWISILWEKINDWTSKNELKM